MSRRGFGAVLALAAVALSACTVKPSDLTQYQRMQGEGTNARAEEHIACRGRDLVCARLVTMRGEACADTMNDATLAAATRQQRRACAMANARALPGLMPADAPAADADRANLLVFDTGLALLADPATTPDDTRATVSGLATMPGGEPYARTLAAEASVLAVLQGNADQAADCAALARVAGTLPGAAANPPSGPLAIRVATLRTNIRSAQTVRSCVP